MSLGEAPLNVLTLQRLVASGARPKVHLLERLLACLKLWNLPEKHNASSNYGPIFKVNLGLIDTERAPSRNRKYLLVLMNFAPELNPRESDLSLQLEGDERKFKTVLSQTLLCL